MTKSSTPFRYGTDNLERICTTLRLDSLVNYDGEPADTVFFFDLGGTPSRADIRRGIVEHIGYRIFGDTARTVTTLPIFDFLERFALEADLPFENANYTELAKISYKNMKASDLKGLFPQDKQVSVKTVDYMTYNIEWTGKDCDTCGMTVPVSYELLRGTQLPENERRLFDDLTRPDTIINSNPGKPVTVDKNRLDATFKTNCFILRGHKLFSKHLTSDRYYEPDTSSTELAFKILDNESYPVESISNMLSGVDIPNNLKVKLKMIAYPREIRTITIPLTRMIAYFLGQGCEIFTGLTRLTNEETQYTVICRNAPMGYCHSMKINVPLSGLSDKEGLATAKITPFIPLPKIYNLFSEQ